MACAATAGSILAGCVTTQWFFSRLAAQVSQELAGALRTPFALGHDRPQNAVELGSGGTFVIGAWRSELHLVPDVADGAEPALRRVPTLDDRVESLPQVVGTTLGQP